MCGAHIRCAKRQGRGDSAIGGQSPEVAVSCGSRVVAYLVFAHVFTSIGSLRWETVHGVLSAYLSLGVFVLHHSFERG